MRGYDLDLLRFLQVLIEEQSVSVAAQRMNVSEPAMSRHLAKLRVVFGDPLLVPCGRHLIASAFALGILNRVQEVVRAADTLVETRVLDNLHLMSPKFVIRANDVVISVLALPLLEALRRDCPNCELVFAPEFDDEADLALRKDSVDLYIGATDILKSEIRRQTLFYNMMKALVRKDHPIFKEGITPESLTHYDHISVSRRGRARGPIDKILQEQYGLMRRIVLVVPNYKAMVDSIRYTDLIVTLPDMVINHVPVAETGLATFDYPFALPYVDAFQAWHPRRDNDPVHSWLRETVYKVAKKIDNIG